MHERLAGARVNAANKWREFFHATALETKTHLADLAGEMLEFTEVPEALEFRQCQVASRGSIREGSHAVVGP